MLACAAPAFAQAPEPVNAQNELAYRAGLGRADDIKLLIKQGASANGLNKEGLPLLLVAAGRKDDEAANAVRALLEGGAEVNAKDKDGQTALYYAARNGKKDVVDVLLKRKIDYYSLDQKGDIARTIAFRAGHADIVQMMDNFVKAETLQAENMANMPDDQKLANEEKARQRAEQEKKKKALLLEKKAREKELREYKENVKKLPGKIYDIAYASCAFQYWSFVQATNQTIPLSDEQLEETISIHKNEVKENALEVMKMFKAGHSYVNQVINPSKQRIFNELDQMPSRTYRKELGVGTPEDVAKRCERVAKSWQVAPPKNPQRAKAATPKSAAKKRAIRKPNQKIFPGQSEKVPLGQ